MGYLGSNISASVKYHQVVDVYIVNCLILLLETKYKVFLDFLNKISISLGTLKTYLLKGNLNMLLITILCLK